MNNNRFVLIFGLILFFSVFAGAFISMAQAATVNTSMQITSITPKTAALGQLVSIVGTISPEPPSGYAFHGIVFSVIDSNGNYRIAAYNKTQANNGEFHFSWIPDIAGRYLVNITYPGETLSGVDYTRCQSSDSFFVDASIPTPTPVPTPLATPEGPSPSNNPSNNTPTGGSGTELSISCQSSTTYTNFKVNIQGTLTTNNVAVSNEPIQLSYSVNGGDSWEALTYLSTDDSGAFQAVWTPTVTGNYFIKATYAGNSELAAASTTVHIAVIPFEDTTVFSVASNSTVTALAFNSTSQTLSFKVSGETGTTGYSNVYIAKTLLSDASNLHVYFDQELLQPTTQSVGDSWLVSFTYHHSVHSVALELDSDSAGTSAEPQDLLYIIAGVAAAALAVAIVAILLLKSRAKRNST